MAATGFTPISLYYSSTTGTSPTAGNLVAGELALNTFDGKLFYKDSAGVVQVIATKGTGTIGGSNTQVQYNSSGAFAGDADFTFNGTTVTMANDASISGLTVGKGLADSQGTALGNAVLSANTTGFQNAGAGYQALKANTTGYINSGFGAFALTANTTGNANSAFGRYALLGNTTASNNSAFGSSALETNTTGASNTAIGASALALNTTASNNTAVGYQALYSHSGSTGNNAAVGYQALYANTTGISNVALGFALNANTTGSDNSAVGWASLYSNTTGSSNTGLGRYALFSNTTASNNTAVGYQSLYTNTTGYQNTAIGWQSAYSNTTGLITAIGSQAGYKNTTGVDNIAIGGADGSISPALYNNTTGSYNSAIGYGALGNNTTASNNTAVGYQALYSKQTGDNNTAIGYQAGYGITTGVRNTALGRFALNGAVTGEDNVGVGNGALYSMTSGNFNTAIGSGAGNAITTGGKNTILGAYSGNQGGLDIRTSSNYIVLSDGDGNPTAYWRNDGKMFTKANVTDSEALQITNIQATRPYGLAVTFSGSTPNNTTQYFFAGDDSTNAKVFIYSSGTISNRTGTYNTISDAKIKQDITDATSQWEDIKSIRFRKYRLIDDVNANPDAPYLMGVVAQEIQQTSPNLVEECVDKEGVVTLGVKQSIIFMKAAKALQEAMERIETLEAKVQQLENK